MRQTHCPSLVVGAPSARHVVGGRVGLKPASFLKSLTACEACAAADAQKAQAPAARTDGDQRRGELLDRVGVERRRDTRGLVR